MNPEEMNETPDQAIAKYTTDFTKLAADGKLDPVIGRDEEIRRTIQVLSRRTKNNPVFLKLLLKYPRRYSIIHIIIF